MSGHLVFTLHNTSQATLASYMPTDADRSNYSHALFTYAYKKSQTTTHNIKVQYTRSMIDYAFNKADVAVLVCKVKAGEDDLDQGQRWSIVQKAVAHSIEAADDLAKACI